MSSTIVGPGIDAEQRNLNNPNVPITWDSLASIWAGGADSGVAEAVSPQASMKISTVWACVRILANAIAKMPLHVYERTDAGRRKASEHPAYALLHLRPNDEMSSFTFRRTMETNKLLWGNGYAEIVRNTLGTPVELVPIESSRVKPYRENGELRYRVTNAMGGHTTLLRRDMLHVPGLSYNGIEGLSVIAHARQTLSATMSQDRYSTAFYKNGCRPGGVLQHPGKLTPPAMVNLRTSFAEQYAGPNNAGRPIILEEGMIWNTGTVIPPEDAQFVETHYVYIEDLCRWFGVQPHKVQHLLRSTNNNIEQQSLDFSGDSVEPEVENWEQELNWKLFLPQERGRFYSKFRTQSLIRMDSAARANYYSKMFPIGAISSNEIRELEEMNHLEDTRGDVHYVPLNLTPAPTIEQSDRLLEANIAKGGQAAKATPAEPEEPKVDQGA